MSRKQYALFEPGGNVARGFRYGKLVEVRYLDVVRTGIESPDRDVFIGLVKDQNFTEDELGAFRIGYVDDKGVGEYCGWQEFLDMVPETG